MNSPIPWVGSKKQLKKDIIALFPQHTTYVEPFFGGGSVYFEKAPSKVEVINDYDSNIINFYKVLQNDKDSLLNKIDNSLISRELFMEYRASNWSELEPLERAYRFIYILKCSFGGLFRFNQKGECNSPFAGNPSPKSKSSLFSKNTEKYLKEAHTRLKNSIIENGDYKEIVKRYDTDTTLFFFDPPYNTDYSYGVKFNYDELLEVCRGLKGKFILTLNAELKDKFKEFIIIDSEVNYSITCKCGDNKKSEIIVMNYTMNDSLKSVSKEFIDSHIQINNDTKNKIKYAEEKFNEYIHNPNKNIKC